MKVFLEREVKLAPPPDLDLSQLDGERGPDRAFDSLYYDTADRALLRRGVTLRRRSEGESAAWQLKLPSRGDRLELELAASGETPPEEAVALLLALTRRRPLELVATLRTSRETRSVSRDGTHVADVALDSVSVLEGERIVAAFDELEVELADGDAADLARLEKRLRAAGAEDAPGASKLARALGIQEPAAPPPPKKGADPADVLAAALREQFGRMLAHDPGTRAGVDAEDVHQFRVATRRLRAFLRSGAPLLEPEWAEATRAELSWLGGLLGGVRDLDVLLEHLRGEAETLEPAEREELQAVLGALEADREQARARLLEGLATDRYLALLERLEQGPLLTAADVSLRSLWRKEQRRAERAAAALGAVPADAELHDLRIRVKRARYAAELGRAALGKQGERFVDAAKHVQDVLGEHQDSTVAEDALRRHVGVNAGAALAVGRLIERERGRRAAARTGWRDAWAALEKRAKALAA
jgi:CHAD domain-containing protein